MVRHGETTQAQSETQARLRAYFGDRVERFGRDPRGVDWQSAAAQQARFEALLRVGDLDGRSVLDAGCGLGDLYGYLRARGIHTRYTGCDLSAPHLELARQSYPGVRFVTGDALDLLRSERFDYVLACGLLHLRVPRWNRWAWTLVRAMYASCLRGLAFTLPRRGAGHAPILAAVEPADWLARLHTLCPAAEASLLDPWGDVVFTLRRDGGEGYGSPPGPGRLATGCWLTADAGGGGDGAEGPAGHAADHGAGVPEGRADR